MWDDLTQEQQWGFQYAAQLRGGGATAEQMALEHMQTEGSRLYEIVLKKKWDLVKSAVEQADPEDIQALLDQFNIPNVIQ